MLQPIRLFIKARFVVASTRSLLTKTYQHVVQAIEPSARLTLLSLLLLITSFPVHFCYSLKSTSLVVVLDIVIFFLRAFAVVVFSLCLYLEEAIPC